MSEASDRWQAFLATHAPTPARTIEETRQEIRAAHDSDILADLSDWSLIRAGGADVVSFLQGQLTNDVRALTSGRSQLSAWCTPKGRVLVIFRVFRYGEDLLLQLPATLEAEVLRRLRMFVLRAKVTLEGVGDELARLGLSGPRAREMLVALGIEAPEAGGLVQINGLAILALPGLHPRYELVAPADQAPTLWERLAVRARPVGSDAWAWLNIRAGLPEVWPGTVEEFVPQMTNLDLLEGVSFSKGCYPGQEIVARVKYLGRIKQRMFPAWSAAIGRPAPGTPVFSAVETDQPVGSVIDARPAPDGGFDLLAVVSLDKRGADLRLASADGPAIELRAPYAPIENDV